MSRVYRFDQFVDLMNRKHLNTRKTFERLAVRVRRQLSYEAKKNATTYPRRRTGELYKSIKATVKPTQDEFLISLTAGNESAFYARFVELGTSGKGSMAPRYYLRRAFEKVNNFVPNDLRKYLGLYLRDPDFYGQRE
tara:strand:+ start:183 stop:593 length:411 start_codon:yes stop_codon:yes gene_type:complete